MSANPLAASPVAALRVDGDRSSFMMRVTEDARVGYRIAIDCVERCTRAIHYRAATSDTPMGMFIRDQDDLVFSLWSGGSAYRVIVWSVSDRNVRKVIELSSRGEPDFMTGLDGSPMIQTYEADSAALPLRRVRWIFRHGRFVRHRPGDK
jgi:hypothetical protein